MNRQPARLTTLLRLCHDLADPRSQMAILAEGNASCRLRPGAFLVKASGASMAALRRHEIVECRASTLLPLLDSPSCSDAAVESALMNSRVDARAKKPSVEALFHAWLLTLPGVEFVGHTHAPQVTGILCSPRARAFARRRIFPDEIVCCDVESVLVPYTDPGLLLARAIRAQTVKFIRKHGRPPRVILLGNHGLITLGGSPDAVTAAMRMAEKTAAIWLAAATLGGPKFLTAARVARIAGRGDEKFRRRLLGLQP